jgi:hypothetical protein
MGLLAKAVGTAVILYLAWKGLEESVTTVLAWKRAYDKDKRLGGSGGPIIDNN